ncbi:hypothetical protein KAW55_08050 [bacterium]|nr:hypothetical protein [bacterium]
MNLLISVFGVLSISFLWFPSLAYGDDIYWKSGNVWKNVKVLEYKDGKIKVKRAEDTQWWKAFDRIVFKEIEGEETVLREKEEEEKVEKVVSLAELSEKKRKKIWEELVLAERRARKEAEGQYPIVASGQSLRVGQAFQLTKETPLMPELEPADPMAALQKMRRLPSGATIKVLRVVKKHQTPWYFVKATSPSKPSLGSGWINSIALIRQGDFEEQMEKQSELEDRLIDKYKDELAKKYGLTREQLVKIVVEGAKKHWPFPR